VTEPNRETLREIAELWLKLGKAKSWRLALRESEGDELLVSLRAELALAQRQANEPRLLHKQSQRGYTNVRYLAIPTEPEAIDAALNERYAREAQLRDELRASATASNTLTQRDQRIAAELAELEAHPQATTSGARDDLRVIRKRLEMVKRKLSGDEAA